MEYGPSNPTSFEAPTVETATPDNKDSKTSKKSSSESRVPSKQQKVERDIASSLDRMSLFEGAKPNKSDRADAAPSTIESSEQLSSTETQHVQQSIAQEHLETMQQADAEASEELKPAVDFLQQVSEGADVEQAFVEAAAEAGMDEAAIAEALAATGDQDSEPDETAAETAPEATNDDDEASIDTHTEDDATPPPVAGGSGGSAGGNRGGAGGGGHGGGIPPRPPLPPLGPVPGGSANNPTPGSNPNTPGTPNTFPAAANRYYYRRNNRGNVLAAGLTGYLLGRRRGRIKTEQKLIPLQRKLEKKVISLEQDITRKERLLVQAKVTRAPVKERIVQSIDARKEITRVGAVERVQPGRPETRLGLEKPKRAERLGHMAVAVEAPAEPIEKIVERTRFERPNNIREAFRPEHVKNMHRNEVLELSEKIIVEGASLRRIYETNLIGEKQLRHLVTEYLSGKDIRRDLRKEMVEREIDFERDPILRDRVRSRLAGHDDGGGLNELLAQAGALPNEDDAYDKRQSAADKRAQESQKRMQRQRQTADTAMVTAIVVLAVVVLVLVLHR